MNAAVWRYFAEIRLLKQQRRSLLIHTQTPFAALVTTMRRFRSLRRSADMSHIFEDLASSQAKDKDQTKKGKKLVSAVKFKTQRMIHTKIQKRAGDIGFKEQYDNFKGFIEELESLKEFVDPIYETLHRIFNDQLALLNAFTCFFTDASDQSIDISSSQLRLRKHIEDMNDEIGEMTDWYQLIDDALAIIREAKKSVKGRDRLYLKVKQSKTKYEHGLADKRCDSTTITLLREKAQRYQTEFTALNNEIRKIFVICEELKPYLLSQALTKFLHFQCIIYRKCNSFYSDAHRVISEAMSTRAPISRSKLELLGVDETSEVFVPFRVADDTPRRRSSTARPMKTYFNNPPFSRFEKFQVYHVRFCPYLDKIKQMEEEYGIADFLRTSPVKFRRFTTDDYGMRDSSPRAQFYNTGRHLSMFEEGKVTEFYDTDIFYPDAEVSIDSEDEVFFDEDFLLSSALSPREMGSQALETGDYVTALYDCEGDPDNEELSFRGGDMFILLNIDDPEWFSVCLEADQSIIGYVPYNYVSKANLF